jgi:Flp pilus assembly protein TadD
VGDFKSAEKHLLRHMEENPGAIRARIMLGRIYERSGLAEKAHAMYNDALAYEPGNRDAEARRNTLLRNRVMDTAALPKKPILPATAATQEHGREGGLTHSAGKEETAAKAAFPSTVPLRIIFTASEKKAEDMMAELHRGKPFFFLAHDSASEKISSDEYRDLGMVDPMTLHPAVREAVSSLQPGRTSSIIRLGEGRYAIIQVKDMGHFAEAEKVFSAGNHQDAEQHLLKHLRLNPEDTEARMMLASLYEMRGDFAGAEDAYYQAMVFKPGAPGPYERLGKMYLEQRHYARARDIFGRGLRMTSSRRLFEELMEIANTSILETVR